VKTRITKRVVDALDTPPRGKRIKVYDTNLSGFGVTAHPTGQKSFFIEYGPRRRQRRMTIGKYGPLTVEAARNQAQAHLGTVAKGGDPLTDGFKDARQPLFIEWVHTYLEIVRVTKKIPRHDEGYLALASRRWRSRRIGEVSADDIRKVRDSISKSGKQTTANRWHASVRACLQAAWRLDLISENPAMRVKPLPEAEPRKRVLSDDELRRFLTALSKEQDPHVRAAFQLLLDTGARKSEVLGARWEDFELDTSSPLWRIPSPKAGRPQVIPVLPSTTVMLQHLPRLGPYVIPGRDPSKPRYDLKRPWQRLTRDAELDDVHIHDLRRTFGLHIARTAGVHIASKLLRHSDVRVTERVYAPLDLEDLREHLERVKSPAEVVQFPIAQKD